MKKSSWSLVGLALMFGAASAQADIAPRPGYVETCKVQKQQGDGEQCTSCSTYFAERDKCEKQLKPQGFTHRCRTRGASVWSEVWCKAAPKSDKASDKASDSASDKASDKASDSASDKASTSGSSSSANPIGGAPIAAGAIGALALLAGVLLRRTRERPSDPR